MDGRRTTALGALLMGIAVVLGAFGAHGLRARLSPDLLEIWETGVRYHAYHAIGLVLAGLFALVAERDAAARGARPAAGIGPAAVAFTLGIAVFSGSLYALALTGLRKLGAITPIGGVAFIAGWILLARAVLRRD